MWKSAVVGIVVFAAATTAGQAPTRTTKDEVYSAAQAARGKTLFEARCVGCHQGGMGPALDGDEFLATWDGKTARALYSRILTTMPSDDPGSLSEPQVLDLVAYILGANGSPAGAKDIESANELNDTKIVRAK